MNSSDKSVTVCRLCQNYNPEGRRGGFCEKLDVPVLAAWEACSLATHPFEISWQPSHTFNNLLSDSLHEPISAMHNHENITELQEINMRSLSLNER
jgi:hypothetical protein